MAPHLLSSVISIIKKDAEGRLLVVDQPMTIQMHWLPHNATNQDRNNMMQKLRSKSINVINKDPGLKAKAEAGRVWIECSDDGIWGDAGFRFTRYQVAQIASSAFQTLRMPDGITTWNSWMAWRQNRYSGHWRFSCQCCGLPFTFNGHRSHVIVTRNHIIQ